MKYRWLVAACVVLLPGLLLFPAWQLGGLGAREDDILYYLPSRTWFGEMLRAGWLPFLNPWTGLDRPFLADPQSAVFYPTTWLFAVLPPLAAYAASLWLHYSLALWGMYRLLRSANFNVTSALFGGVAFAFCGFLVAHRAHFALQHAAAWTPWVFWRLARLAEQPNARRLVFAALLAALQAFAGHIQIAALTALGTLVWLLGAHGARRRVLTGWAGTWLLAGGLFAVQFVPTLLLIRECTRTQRGYLDFVENSWCPQSLVGWWLPMFFGQRTPNFFDQPYWGPSHQVEQFSYGGLSVLILTAGAIVNGWRGDRQRRPWVALLIFALLLALGLFGPICPLIYWLPGANLFRVPARGLLLVNLAGAALAAGVVNELAAPLSPRRARLRWLLLRWTSRPLLLPLLAISGVLAATALLAWLLPSDLRNMALGAAAPWRTSNLVPLGLTVISLFALRWIVRAWDRPRRTAWMIPLLLLDLGIIGWTIDIPAGAHSPSDLLESPGRSELLRYLSGSSGRLWIVTGRQHGVPGEYVDSINKLAANTNILAHVATLTDYGPLQPRFVPPAMQFKPWGECEHPAELLASPDWLRAVGVEWVLLCEPDLPAPPGELVATLSSGYRLYHVLSHVADINVEGLPAGYSVDLLQFSPYELRIRLHNESQSGSANHDDHLLRVTIPRLAWNGWRVAGDDAAAIERTPEGLITFAIHQSLRGELAMGYSPPGLAIGAMISGGTVLVLLLLFGFEWRQRAA